MATMPDRQLDESPLTRHRNKPVLQAGKHKIAMNESWVQGEENFQRRLADGHHWAQKVSERLLSMGHDVLLTPYSWKPIAERQEFVNEYDIAVRRPGKKPVLLESKSRNLKFLANPSSYPYRTALVDTVQGWNKKTDPVAAVLLISQQTEQILVVPSSTKPHWGIKKTFDRVRGFEDQWYECPIKFLKTLEDLSAWLNRS